MFTYRQLINRLFNVNRMNGLKQGLSNSVSLQQLYEYPDRLFSSIHVAGTNGKGSVATKLAAGLQASGYRVGLYTSPHISCFRERIQVNQEMIAEKDVEEILATLFKDIERHQIPATFFEITTFLAFLYFSKKRVDVAVIEAGIGGRFDATNVIKPLLSIITSISLDHTEILGDSIESITVEKGGIIKQNVPVIIGPHVDLEIIQKIAFERQSSCQQVRGVPVNSFDQENKAIASAAMIEVSKHFNIKPEAMLKGLDATPPCRCEIMECGCPIVLDVAHNPDGLLRLFQSVNDKFPKRMLRVLFGLSTSKDIAQCIDLIVKKGIDFHPVQAPGERGTPVSSLELRLLESGISRQSIYIDDTIDASVQRAIREAERAEQVLVICGSFFIMSSVRDSLGFQEPFD